MENGLSSFQAQSGYPILGMESHVGSAVKTIAYLFHAGRIAEAEKELKIELLHAQSDRGRQIVESLTQIAMSTDDNNLKNQMFYAILQLGYGARYF